MTNDMELKAQKYNQQGVIYANQNKLSQAVECFKKALKAAPNANSYYLLGVACQVQGQLDEAEKNLSLAIRFSPAFSMAYNNLGSIYLKKKDFLQAVSQFELAISHNPKNAFAYNNLGNACRFLGWPDKAIENYQKALKLNPSLTDTLGNLGLIYFETNQFDKSIKYLNKAIQIDPNYAQAYFHLAAVFARQEKLEQAVATLESYVKLVPRDDEAYSMLANFYLNMGLLEKSRENFHKALILNPDSPYIMNDLGNLYKQAGDLTNALNYYLKALKYNPSLAGTLNNIGTIYLNQGKLKQAIDVFNQALKLDPNLASAYYHLGLIYERQDQLDKAIENLRSAIKLNPNLTLAIPIIIIALMQQCDWEESLKECTMLDQIISAELKEGRSTSEQPLLNVIRKPNPKINYQIAKSKSDQIEKSIAGDHPAFSFKNRGRKKIIRIGYLSNDFHTHATAYLTLSLFKMHNRQRFEIYAYSYGKDDDSSYRKKIEKDSDKFRDIFNVGFREAADLIYEDQVDILVDLKGHTRNSRLEICALRPAPIQADYLGFPGTTGASFIDYIITDRVVTPPAAAPFYSEKFVYLPDSYQVNDNTRPIWDGEFNKRNFGLPEDTFVYASFNKSFKIDYPTFQSWMRILKNVPGSVLWLLQSNPFAPENIKKEADKHKIDPKRIIFSGVIAHNMHLKRLQLADLALDTFIYNGHTTTSDALWAGVPVVTLQGNHFASRVSSSILTAIDLPELITHSSKEYEDLAIKLAKSPKLLKSLKEKLNKNRLTKPLFDTERFTKNLEVVYQKMWQNYLDGKKLRQIIVKD